MPSLQILTYFALHLVNFVQLEHALHHNTPGFIEVSVITYYFGCEHESGNKKIVIGQCRIAHHWFIR
jgi:hypothetical protein